MRLFLLLFTFNFFSCSFGQIYKGIEGLEPFQEDLAYLDNILKSNPNKYKSHYQSLRKLQKENNNQNLGSILDVYQGSFHYYLNNMDSAIYYFDLAMAVSSEIGNEQIFRTAKIRKIFTDDHKKTKFQMAKEMEEIYVDSYNKSDTINMLYSLNGLGLFYGKMDSVSISMTVFYEALRLADMSGNMYEKGFVLNNLGLVKYDLGVLDSAFSDFQQCLEIGDNLNNLSLQALGHQNKGLYYARVDSNEMAKKEYLKVMDLGKEFGYINYILSSSTNLSALEIKMGNEKRGDSLNLLALDLAKEGGYLHTLSAIYMGRAFLMIRTEKLNQALEMLDSAEVYSQYASFVDVIPALYHLKYRVYKEQGDCIKALEVHEAKVSIDDSLAQIGNAKLMAELQFKYDDEKKERIRSIEKNELKLQIKQGEVDMGSYRQNVIIVISAILIILFILIILYVKLKQKSDNLFSFAIANKLEEERGRIARDLHDGLGQSMIVLKNKFNRTKLLNEKEADELNNNFKEVIQEVRAISRSLIPPELGRLGLQKAIQKMLDDIENSVGMIVTSDIDFLSDIEFEEHQRIRVYRIVQELCTNTIKHAGASSIKLDAFGINDDLEIVYQDNGTGFDLEKWRSAGNSVGIKSIQQRLKYLKGTIKVVKSEIGFKVNIKIPIQ